jgi:hypothetical protein
MKQDQQQTIQDQVSGRSKHAAVVAAVLVVLCSSSVAWTQSIGSIGSVIGAIKNSREKKASSYLNCRYPKNSVEHVICSDADLMKANDRMQTIFHQSSQRR